MASMAVVVSTVVARAVEGRPLPARQLPTKVGTGLGAPEYQRFRARLTECLRHVESVWPGTRTGVLLSNMLQEGLRNRLLLDASDDELTAFLLYAAETRLHVPAELIPVADRNEYGAVTIAAVESVKGLCDLLRRGGAKQIQTESVYERDVFHHDVENGLEAFRHSWNGSEDRGRLVACYAGVRRRGGQWDAKVLTVAEIEEVRKASNAPNHRAWRDYYARMGQLAALRALSVVLPQHRDKPRTDYADVAAQEATTLRPMVSLDPGDPYGLAYSAPRTTGTEDYTVTEEPLFTDADHAGRETLPGEAHHFHGYGKRTVAECPSAILRGVRQWIANDLTRRARYARLDQAITIVLRARKAANGTHAGAPR